MTKKSAKKDRKSAPSKTSGRGPRQEAATALLDVHLSGAILSVVADRVAQGKVETRLSEVLLEAEQRCMTAAWRQYIEKLV